MVKRGMPPKHPGRILKNMYLEPLGLSVTKAAQGLGVSRNALSAIVNQKAGITPEMAIKLSEAFGTTAELWNNMQKTYDLWNAKQSVSRDGITRFHPIQSPA